MSLRGLKFNGFISKNTTIVFFWIEAAPKCWERYVLLQIHRRIGLLYGYEYWGYWNVFFFVFVGLHGHSTTTTLQIIYNLILSCDIKTWWSLAMVHKFSRAHSFVLGIKVLHSNIIFGSIENILKKCIFFQIDLSAWCISIVWYLKILS